MCCSSLEDEALANRRKPRSFRVHHLLTAVYTWYFALMKKSGMLRVEPEVLKQLHAEAKALTVPPGRPPTLSDVVRLAVEALKSKRTS